MIFGGIKMGWEKELERDKERRFQSFNSKLEIKAKIVEHKKAIKDLESKLSQMEKDEQEEYDVNHNLLG